MVLCSKFTPELDGLSHIPEIRLGLQARVALGIALGQSTREICSSCQTTRATVKSYRLRSYQTLGVHSARELREMLLRDTGLTT